MAQADVAVGPDREHRHAVDPESLGDLLVDPAELAPIGPRAESEDSLDVDEPRCVASSPSTSSATAPGYAAGPPTTITVCPGR